MENILKLKKAVAIIMELPIPNGLTLATAEPIIVRANAAIILLQEVANDLVAHAKPEEPLAESTEDKKGEDA